MGIQLGEGVPRLPVGRIEARGSYAWVGYVLGISNAVPSEGLFESRKSFRNLQSPRVNL